MIRRLRSELKALFELVLLPGLALLLPWRWCFQCFRAFCFLPLYRERCEASLAVAQSLGYVDNPRRWLRRHRLVLLVDHADLYLSASRSDAWLGRHLRREGRWPAPGEGFIACTFHWGAGMWGLRDARRAGVDAHALVGAVAPEQFAGQHVIGRYSCARLAEVGQALGHSPLDIGRDLRRAVTALAQGRALFAAVDVPPDQVASATPIRFLGHTIHAPIGVFRLAVRRRLPVVLYLTGFDFATGRRYVHVSEPLLAEDLSGLVVQAYAYLEEWIRREPACWHFWCVWDVFRKGEVG